LEDKHSESPSIELPEMERVGGEPAVGGLYAPMPLRMRPPGFLPLEMHLSCRQKSKINIFALISLSFSCSLLIIGRIFLYPTAFT
jgi:hypothetical protein